MMSNQELEKGINRDCNVIAEYIELRVACGYEIDSVVKSLVIKNYVQLNLPKFKRGIKHFEKLKTKNHK